MSKNCVEIDQIIDYATASVDVQHSAHMSRRQRMVLPVVLLAVIVVPMSISGTAVALNNIHSALGGNASELQWIVNAFNLAFACFTLVWGSLADKYGYRKLFAYGASIFALGAIVSGLTDNIILLDIARGIAGIGGSAIFSCGGAMLSHLPDPQIRARAFAYFGSIAGIGLALGPTISGFFIEWWNFRPLFIVQGGILIVVVILTQFIRVNQHIGAHEHSFDLAGIVTLVIGLFSFMCYLVEGQAWGWYSLSEIAILLLSFMALGIFIKVELHKPYPLLELRFLAKAKFLGLILVPVVQGCGFVTLLTYYPTFLMIGAHYSSVEAGYMIISLTIPVILGPMIAAYLVNKGYFSVVNVIYTSLVALIIGDAAVIICSHEYPTPALLISALFITGIGMGFSTGLIDGEAIAQVPAEHAGMAAGIINTFRLSGEAISVALYAVLIESFLAGVGSHSAYVIAFKHTVEVIVLIVVVLSLIITKLLSYPRVLRK